MSNTAITNLNSIKIFIIFSYTALQYNARIQIFFIHLYINSIVEIKHPLVDYLVTKVFLPFAYKSTKPTRTLKDELFLF